MVTIYKSIGKYEDALLLYEEVLKIDNKSPNCAPQKYVQLLNNLASIYKSIGEYEKALKLYRKVPKIYRINKTMDRRSHGNFLNNLALLYEVMGQYVRALPRHKKAVEILGETLGIDHPDYATALNNLGNFYNSMGQYEESENLYRKAIYIFKQRLGDHPDYAASLSSLACLCVATNRPEEALKLMQEAAEINLTTISKIFSISTDDQRLNYLKQNYYELERFLSLVFQHFPNNSEAIQSAYNLILKRKAIATETAILQKIALLSEKYAHLAPILEELPDIRQQLAKRYFDISTPEELPRYRRELNFLEQQAENLERDLNIPELNLEKELQNADFETIALELPQETTLVEFVRFDNYNFQAIAANDEAAWCPPHYLAFILPFDAPEQLTLIDLGEAQPIDELVKRFRKSVENGRGLDLDPIPDDEIPPKIKLRQLIFDQLIPYLTTV